MKKILIIGGTGYIGSALYPYLSNLNDDMGYGFKAQRYQVDTVDLEWFGNYVNPNNLIMDYRHLTKEQLAKYDVVILLAGYSSPAICNNSGKDAVIRNNFSNFSNLLEKLTHQKFIYASTIAVYDSKGEELTEEHPLILTPGGSYEWSKVECDILIQQCYPQLEYYGLRLATLSGVSDNWRADLMVNAMTNTGVRQSEVRVFNPDNHKPILYLQDLCRAIDTIISSPQNKKGFYNLASYNGVTEEIATVVADITNSKLNVLGKSEMQSAGLPSTSYDFIISTKKFEEEFGFKFTGTTEGITTEIVTKLDSIHHSKRIEGIQYK